MDQAEMIWHARQSVPLVRSNPGQALMIIWAREGVFATRAQSSGRALLIIIACEAVVATRAQTSRASIDKSKVTRGGLCHKGAVIASEL